MWSRLLQITTVLGIAVSLYMAFVVAPIEEKMGVIQKIFYYHVPSAFMHVGGMGVTNMSRRGIVEGHDLRGDDPRRFPGVHKQRLIHGAHFYETESQKNALNSPTAFTL